MTDREKLIDLAHDYFKSVPWYADIADLNPEELIDHLLANGVRLESEQATSNENKRWIPVTERLPEKMGFVLGCSVDGIVGEMQWYRENVFYWAGSDEDAEPVSTTHWMPLPEPPKEEMNNG